MKTLPLIIIMLLVASPVLGAVGPTGGLSRSLALDGATYAQVESPSNEAIHVFDIPSSELTRPTVEAHHVDLSPSLDPSTFEVDERIQTRASLERTESASNDGTRQQLILDELNGIEQCVIALQSARHSVIERFNDDNLTAQELLVEFAQIDVEVRTFNERRVTLRDVTNRALDFSASSGQLTALERELDTFTGPVRTHVVTVMTGEADVMQFSTRASKTGVVLSVVANGEYVREAYRVDLRDRDQRTIIYEETLDIVAESYPTIYFSRTVRSRTNIVSAGDGYRVRVNYDYGQSAAYVDIGSGRVLKESRTRPLRSISTTVTTTRARDGLALTVDRTYPGGSFRIRLNKSEAGDPVDTNVTIRLEVSQENTLLGHTGSDGTFWVISPSAPYVAMVIEGNLAVVLATDPIPTPTLVVNPTDTENDMSPMVTLIPTESVGSPGPSRITPQGVLNDSSTVGSPMVD